MKTKVAVLSNQSIMDKIKHFYGVDISKSFFDVMNQDSKHDQFSNDLKGFKSLLKFIKKDSLVVMETTGYYHYGVVASRRVLHDKHFSFRYIFFSASILSL
ncbi:IS110 family transposase [Christiangramia echinicola]|uniref:IS110 family transposase n=1 Tax=Christiangramia echinicola TaxID=279359 RepID=UPI000410747A|nr:IS110 family transposase [Christiangramia echinicola]